jgi:hypothetical protein
VFVGILVKAWSYTNDSPSVQLANEQSKTEWYAWRNYKKMSRNILISLLNMVLVFGEGWK